VKHVKKNFVISRLRRLGDNASSKRRQKEKRAKGILVILVTT